jgi:hypothetical protein
MEAFKNTWIVTRHGSNAANQSMTPQSILGTVEAETAEDAKRLAAESFTCYNNQFFSVENWIDADSEACNEASEADAYRAECETV